MAASGKNGTAIIFTLLGLIVLGIILVVTGVIPLGTTAAATPAKNTPGKATVSTTDGITTFAVDNLGTDVGTDTTRPSGESFDTWLQGRIKSGFKF